MVKFTNTGPAGFVGYSVDGGATITAVAIGAASTVTILLPKTTTSLLVYVKANATDDWVASTGSIKLDQSKACEEDPIVVIFTCSGDSGTPSAWQVVNKNDYDISFTWAIVGGPSSSGSIDLPAGGNYSFETAYFPGEMQVFVNGILQAHAFASTCTPPKKLALLQLEAFCSAVPVGLNVWRVINPNNVALNFEWNIQGSTLSGIGNVPAGSHVDLVTSPQGARDTFVLYRSGVLQTSTLSATNCLRTSTKVPGSSPTPSATVPVSGTPPVLIPVTGIDLNAGNLPLSHAFFNLSLGFLGLGLVLNALSRERK